MCTVLRTSTALSFVSVIFSGRLCDMPMESSRGLSRKPGRNTVRCSSRRRWRPHRSEDRVPAGDGRLSASSNSINIVPERWGTRLSIPGKRSASSSRIFRAALPDRNFPQNGTGNTFPPDRFIRNRSGTELRMAPKPKAWLPFPA